MRIFLLTRLVLLSALFPAAIIAQEIYVQQRDSRIEFPDAVSRGTFQPSLGYLAVTSEGKGLKVVAVDPWRTVFTYGQLPNALASLRFLPDGRLLTARIDGQLNFWNTQQGQMARSLTAHSKGIIDAGIDRSGMLVFAGVDNTLSVLDPTSGDVRTSVSLGDGKIVSLAVHPRGRDRVVGLVGNKLAVYDSMLVQTKVVSDLRETPTSLAFSSDGLLLASGGIDGAVRLFETDSWKFLRSSGEQRGPIGHVSFHPRNRWLAAVSKDSTLKIYDVKSFSVVKTLTLPDAAYTFVSFVSEEAMVTGDSRGRLSTWTVLERAPDTTAPAITILQPTRYAEDSPTRLYASDIRVFGLVYDESEITAVMVGDKPAKLSAPKVENESAREAGLMGKEFEITTPLAAVGMNRIDVSVRDVHGNVSSQPLYIQRLSASEAIEILEPAERAETDRVAIEVQFRPWFEVSSYSISANTMEVVDRRGLSRIRPGDNIREEVPLIIGYNQIGITVTGKKGERFTKLVGVSRKFSAAISEAIAPPKSPAERSAMGPQRWAVVVGISKYGNPGIPSLKFADRDAEAIAAFLQSPQGGSFDKDHMRILINEDATLPNLREAMIDFLQQAIDKDLVLIYFAGHGAPDPTRPQNLYLLTHDTDPRRLGTTAFPMWDIQTVITRQIQAKKVVVLSDACHSGGISVDVATRGLDVTESNPINQYLAELSRAKDGMVVFTASAAGEVSQEFPDLGHGVFTYYLLEGLKGSADLNNDLLVTVNELMGYVEEQVKRKTRGAQNPTRSQTTYDKELPMSVLDK